MVGTGDDGDEPLQHEQRQLVLHHEHVAADVGEHVELAVAAEDGVVGRVVRRRAAGRRAHDLEQEAPVHDHHLQERVAVAPPLVVEVHVRVLQPAGHLLQRGDQAAHGGARAAEQVEQRAPLVLLHRRRQVRVVAVERAQGHQLRPVGGGVLAVLHVRRDAVHGVLPPHRRLRLRVRDAGLFELLLDVNHPRGRHRLRRGVVLRAHGSRGHALPLLLLLLHERWHSDRSSALGPGRPPRALPDLAGAIATDVCSTSKKRTAPEKTGVCRRTRSQATSF